MLAEVASKEVGRRTGISVTPTIPFGVSYSYKNFPGTITVSSEALMGYISEVCLSLVRSGFRKIVFFQHVGEIIYPSLGNSQVSLERGIVCCVLSYIYGGS